jgi:hypothetical protein
MSNATPDPMLPYLLTLPLWPIGAFGIWIGLAARYEERSTRIIFGSGGAIIICTGLLLIIAPNTGFQVLIALMVMAGGAHLIWIARHNLDNSYLWPRMFVHFGPAIKPLSQRVFTIEQLSTFRKTRSIGCGALLALTGWILVIWILVGTFNKVFQ